MENVVSNSTCSILLLPSLLGVDRTWLVSERQSSPREVLTWKIVDKRFRGLKSISGEPSPPKARALAGLMAECRRITFFIRSPFVHSSSTSWSTLLGSDGWERQDVIVGSVRLSVFCNKAYKQIARQGHHPPSHQPCCSALTRQLHFKVTPEKDSKSKMICLLVNGWGYL